MRLSHEEKKSISVWRFMQSLTLEMVFKGEFGLISGSSEGKEPSRNGFPGINAGYLCVISF